MSSTGERNQQTRPDKSSRTVPAPPPPPPLEGQDKGHLNGLPIPWFISCPIVLGVVVGCWMAVGGCQKQLVRWLHYYPHQHTDKQRRRGRERARHGTGQTLVQHDDCSTRRWCWWLVSAFWRVCSSGSAVCCNGRRHEENRGWKDIAEQTMISCSIVESPNNSPKDNNELNDFMWLSFMRFGIK